MPHMLAAHVRYSSLLLAPIGKNVPHRIISYINANVKQRSIQSPLGDRFSVLALGVVCSILSSHYYSIKYFFSCQVCSRRTGKQMPFLTIISYIILFVKLRTSCPKLVRSGVFGYARRGRENWFAMMREERVGEEGYGVAFKVDQSICDSRSGESDRRGRARGWEGQMYVSGNVGEWAIQLHSRENFAYRYADRKFGPDRPRPARSNPSIIIPCRARFVNTQFQRKIT